MEENAAIFSTGNRKMIATQLWSMSTTLFTKQREEAMLECADRLGNIEVLLATPSDEFQNRGQQDNRGAVCPLY